jgi:ammonium transporter, Amt family
MKNPTLQKFAPFVILLIVAVLALFVPQLPSYAGEYSPADIAWILVATALVFIMTPGLAFFYGGMVHRKNIISTMIKSMVSAGIVSVIWISFGFSLSFGESINGIIGNPMTHLFLKGVVDGAPALQGGSAMTIPLLLFVLY